MPRKEHQPKGGRRRRCDGSETPLNPKVHYYLQVGNLRYCESCHKKQAKLYEMVRVRDYSEDA